MVCMVVVVVGATVASADPQKAFDFELSPQQVINGPSAPASAGGMATLRMDPPSLMLGKVVADGVAASRVTLNAGHAGEAGPVIADFTEVLDGTWRLEKTPGFDNLLHGPNASRGYYVRVESDAGALRGQLLPDGWQVQVVHLSRRNQIPQLPVSGISIAGIAIDSDTGSYAVRVTTKDLDRVVRAQLRSANATGPVRVFAELEPSANEPGTWGSGDINGASVPALLPAARNAWLSGELMIRLDVLGDSSQTMEARLPPLADVTPPISMTQLKGNDDE